MTSLKRAVAHYQSLTPKEVRIWLNEEYPPHKKLFDPVKDMLETEYYGMSAILVESGLTSVTFSAGGYVEVVPIHDWHDLLLSQVVNGASADDCDLEGFANLDGEYLATVETLCGLLAPRPLSEIAHKLRKVWSVVKSTFSTKARNV